MLLWRASFATRTDKDTGCAHSLRGVTPRPVPKKSNYKEGRFQTLVEKVRLLADAGEKPRHPARERDYESHLVG